MTLKNLYWIFILFVGASLVLTSCDNDNFYDDCPKGSLETRTLDIDGFTGVELEIAADVRVTQGSEFSVVAEGHEGIINLLELDVKNGVWHIDLRENCRSNYDLIIHITMPEIKALILDGSGNIEGQNTFDLESIDLEINGSGNMDIDLTATQIDADINGSGNMTLEGQAEGLDLRIDGSGNFGNFDFTVDTAIVKINGSGDVSLTANDSLKVTITGSGNVSYKGDPSLEVSITGSGEVRNAN